MAQASRHERQHNPAFITAVHDWFTGYVRGEVANGHWFLHQLADTFFSKTPDRWDFNTPRDQQTAFSTVLRQRALSLGGIKVYKGTGTTPIQKSLDGKERACIQVQDLEATRRALNGTTTALADVDSCASVRLLS